MFALLNPAVKDSSPVNRRLSEEKSAQKKREERVECGVGWGTGPQASPLPPHMPIFAALYFPLRNGAGGLSKSKYTN